MKRTVLLVVSTNVVSFLVTIPLAVILGRSMLSESPAIAAAPSDDNSNTPQTKSEQFAHHLRMLQPTCCVCQDPTPSETPSFLHSASPSASPSSIPSSTPSSKPSMTPSSKPSMTPSSKPSSMPSVNPSSTPSAFPSAFPSASPSAAPSVSPTTAPPSETPSVSPSNYPSSNPTPSTPYPSAAPTTRIPFSIVLKSGTKLTHSSPAVDSPNGLYSFRMGGSDFDDDLVLVRRQLTQGDAVIWRVNSGDIMNVNATATTTLFMQSDGNVVLRAANFTTLWTTNSGKNWGAYLILDNDGQVAIVLDEEGPNGEDIITRLWYDGRPKGFYPKTPPTRQNLEFPVRGIFYYPWFPETWTIKKQPTKFNATLGKYSSGRTAIFDAHLDALEYARIDLGIASWFGPNTNLDRGRISNLLQRSPPTMKWTVYHEDELGYNPDGTEIQADLDYLKYWFAWHDSWAHVDGRPVIFVYNEPNDCSVSERWMRAARGEWYVVLKLFRGFTNCPVQPDSWHQYGPAAAINYNRGHAMSISPGFWKADQDEPALERLSEEQWRENVAKMVERNEQWQLITTFNEWGEGTSVESGSEWESDSGYGYYLDALHDKF